VIRTKGSPRFGAVVNPIEKNDLLGQRVNWSVSTQPDTFAACFTEFEKLYTDPYNNEIDDTLPFSNAAKDADSPRYQDLLRVNPEMQAKWVEAMKSEFEAFLARERSSGFTRVKSPKASRIFRPLGCSRSSGQSTW
jgi:hypothetical protein